MSNSFPKNFLKLFIETHVTIIKWIIVYIKSKGLTSKNSLLAYHFEQIFGFFLLPLVINTNLSIIISTVPLLLFLNYIELILFILRIPGIINSVAEQKKYIPFVGKIFKNKFGFLV
ncbi:DUF4870 domain-containing protein [Chryseobacterium viscerum]|uniref:DUF4870 domain-containing protein n=1 Tax=Chryseobacterium viscerum TaxID=1037377 RepID=A0A5N4BXA9_9FLAO|nr:DUF4870 domain-containing protein [Chryseobacterium viscerum]